MQEVLASQPEETQDFLLGTAILERMCAGLSAAVTGKIELEAQKTLEQLTRANLFIIPLDDERRWFRYHHLFGDLLLARLQGKGAQRMSELYRRAGGGTKPTASRAWPWSPRLKPRITPGSRPDRGQSPGALADHRHGVLLLGQPAADGGDRQTAGWLCLQSAWICVITGQTDRIQPFLEAAERAWDRRIARRRAATRPTGVSQGFCTLTWTISTIRR